MQLKEGEILTKVSPYYLQGPERRFKIHVHEVIAGSEPKFIVVPVGGLGMSSKNEDLHIQASTEAEALEIFMDAIYDMSQENILPK